MSPTLESLAVAAMQGRDMPTTATSLRPERRFRPRTSEEQKAIEDHARAEIHKVQMMVADDPSAAIDAIGAAFAAGLMVGRIQATPTAY